MILPLVYFNYVAAIEFVENEHDRFMNKNNHELLLFIYITSGLSHIHLRNAVRSTWLQPCIQSIHCDYAFFADQSYNRSVVKSNYNHNNVDYNLHHEYQTYHDIVYRDSCDLMERHPDYINYGNSPPTTDNIEHKIINDQTGDVIRTISYPDYPSRRIYKIDWKICFLKHVYKIGRVADYHVFVEDDSYVCCDHLLYQVQKINERLSKIKSYDYHEKINNGSNNVLDNNHDFQYLLSFRTGTPMYDGFDDSSTIMSKDIAMAFMKHYPGDGFNCDFLLEKSNSVHEYMFLSWGNSWSKKHCNWPKLLHDKANVSVNYPTLNCNSAYHNAMAIYQLQQQQQQQPNKSFSVNNSQCYEHPLILHHTYADRVILGDNYIDYINHILKDTTKINGNSTKRFFEHHNSRNFCDNMLLIDKIKEPYSMYALAELESYGDKNYRDYSPVFLSGGYDGWTEVFNQ